MTSESKRWEALKSEYLREVEKALSSVKHPRRYDVLEDVRLHLDQRFSDLAPDRQTPENLRAILNEMGPASDYAELLDAGPAPSIEPVSQKDQLQIAVVYGISFVISLLLSFTIAYNFHNFSLWFLSLFLPLLMPLLVIKLIVFGLFGFYQGRSFSFTSFLKILVAGWISNFLFVFIFFLACYAAPKINPSFEKIIPFENFPQIIFLLDWFFTLVMVCMIQAVGKYQKNQAVSRNNRFLIIIAGVVLSNIILLSFLLPEILRKAKTDDRVDHSTVKSPVSAGEEKGRIVDKIDYPFIDDAQAVGKWKSVDFIQKIEDFEPGVQHWPGDLYLKEMILFPSGSTAGPWTWTKGLIMHPGDRTAAKYNLKNMNGSMYMFFEWKSGDYTIRHMKPHYYVLKKVSSGK
ncbi:MAG: hypothetical protein WC975_02885 [Phycisphaerae bacterium]